MSYTSTTATKVDLYKIVTDRIVTALESGVQPWRKPWNASAPAIAMGRPLRENGVGYTGINTVNLWVSAASRGLTNPYWLTWNRITELGGSVRKGAKSEMAFYVGSKLIRDGDPVTEGETVMEGDDGVRRISFLKYYRVFNASEVDDLPARYQVETEAPAPIDHANPEAAAFIDATGATIAYGRPRACYIPSQDVIHMPAYQSFDPKAQFYSTAFHELVHWTKHESRLNRSVGQVKRWGDEAYAMEELVAELGAAFLCADHNLCNVTEDQSAAYLAAWLKVLKGDNRAIFKAATWAEKAAGYLTDAASKPAPAPVAPALPAPQSEAPAPVVTAAKQAKGRARKRPVQPLAAAAAAIASVPTRFESTEAAILATIPTFEAKPGRDVIVATGAGFVPARLVDSWQWPDGSIRLAAELTASQGRYRKGERILNGPDKIVPVGMMQRGMVGSYRWIMPLASVDGPVPVADPAPAPAAKPAKDRARKRPVPAPVAPTLPAPEELTAPEVDQPAPEAVTASAPRKRARDSRLSLDTDALPAGTATDARKVRQTGRGLFAERVAQDSALAGNVSAMLVARCTDYNSFVAALSVAKAAACKAAGLGWAMQAGLSVMATVPARWVSCKVFGRISRAPRDQRLPAPRFWPGCQLPAGAIVVADAPRETGPIVFGHWQAATDPARYRCKVRKLGWEFSKLTGTWHRPPVNDATAIRDAA